MSDAIDYYQSALERQGHLLHNLLLFGRLLRGLGIEVNPGRMIDTMQALAFVDIGQRSDFYHTLRSLLVNRREQIPLFDHAFALFWRRPANDGVDFDLLELLTPRLTPPPPMVVPPLPRVEAPDSEAAGEDAAALPELIEVYKAYAAAEALRHKDFGNLSGEELLAVKQLMAQLLWNLGQRRTRRLQVGPGRRIDLRRSVRRNLRYGGEVLQWSWLTPKIKPRPLVIIADISGSMEQYTRLLLQFVYSLARSLTQRVESFVFSTRLTRITHPLRRKDVDRALRDVAQTVPDWAGGTRIGEALKHFNYEWGRRVLRGGAVVLLISDGWDRGDPELLGKEVARLQRTSHRLIWLNPLLGSQRYEPLTRGMQAALPFVDDFLPVHNLASLEELADHLAQLDGTGRLRRRTLSGAAFVGRGR